VDEGRAAGDTAWAEREIGMPAPWAGLETIDRGMASLPELFPACKIKTPMLVTKTAVAAKSPTWAAHRCEIITSSATPLVFFIFGREMHSVGFGTSVSPSLSIYISQICENATKKRDVLRYFYPAPLFDKNPPSIKVMIS
jgi:hypothetical protein